MDNRTRILIRGNLQEKNLIELLRYCETNRVTGSITLNREGKEGYVYFRDGKIFRVKVGDVYDQDALNILIPWQDGDYILKQSKLMSLRDLSQIYGKIKILIVEPDDEQSSILANYLQDYCEPIKATTTDEALSILEIQGKWTDILIVRLDQGDEKAIRLVINAKNQNPNLQAILMINKQSPELKPIISQFSSLAFLERPIEEDALKEVISKLYSFQKNIPEDLEYYFDLTDLIKLLCLSNSTASIEIKSPEQHEIGKIYFMNGRIVHVVDGEVDGLEAFKNLIKCDYGEFSIRFNEMTTDKTIRGFWWEIL